MYNSSAVSNPLLSASAAPSSRQPVPQIQPDRDDQRNFQNTLDRVQDEKAASTRAVADKKVVARKEPAHDKETVKNEPVKKESAKASPTKKSAAPAGGEDQQSQPVDDEKNAAPATDADSTQTSSATQDGDKQKKALDKKDEAIAGDDTDTLLALASPLANQPNSPQAPTQLGLIPQAMQPNADAQAEPTETDATLLADKIVSASALKNAKTLPGLSVDDAGTSLAKADKTGDAEDGAQSSLSGNLISANLGTEGQTSLPLADAASTSADTDTLLTTAKTPSTQPQTNNPVNVNSLSQDSENENSLVDEQLNLASDIVNGAALKDKGTLKAAPDATTALAAATQDSLAKDSKTIFEKMLQTVAGSNTTNTAADSTNLAQSQVPSYEPSNNSALDGRAFANGLVSPDSQLPAARSFVVQTNLPVSVGHPQWSQAVGDKVLWLAAQNVSSAEIRLDPPDLGTMQVKVSVNQDQATISFTSHHAQVREVLDQNMNRLRDMLSEQGMHLVNVDVSDKSFARQQGEGKGQQGRAGAGDIPAEEEAPVAVSTIVQKRLVDHYA